MIKLLLAASEAVPYIKTGGLADVAGTLPAALNAAGADARVILPKYSAIPQALADGMTYITSFTIDMGWRRQYCGLFSAEYGGVTYYFIDNNFYFARPFVYGDGQEEGERFGFFCRAVLSAIPHLGFAPDILHCNDWQTGMIPVLLKTQYRHLPEYANIKTVYTIHNLKFQGIYSRELVQGLFNLSDRYFTTEYLEFYGCASYMKGGLVFSDMVTTVSPSYAREIQTPYYGEKLDGVIRMRGNAVVGILNGIDCHSYDPADDMQLPAHFTAADRGGKALCKRALQEELGLERREEAALVGMISRLTEQKGFDLVEAVLDDILRQDLQLAILGSVDAHYESLFSWAQWRYPGRVCFWHGLNEPLAHRIYAGCDLFLMPSKFEPCGLSQMIALRYGTIPVVRETGGLADSIAPYNQFTNEGNGFSFANYNAHEMLYTVERAVALRREHPEAWEGLLSRAMATDFDWSRSAKAYLTLYQQMVAPPAPPETPSPQMPDLAPRATPVPGEPAPAEKPVAAETLPTPAKAQAMAAAEAAAAPLSPKPSPAANPPSAAAKAPLAPAPVPAAKPATAPQAPAAKAPASEKCAPQGAKPTQPKPRRS